MPVMGQRIANKYNITFKEIYDETCLHWKLLLLAFAPPPFMLQSSTQTRCRSKHPERRGTDSTLRQLDDLLLF